MSNSLGMASNALLMSIVKSMVLRCGRGSLNPSKVRWVRSVSRVVVEWCGLKPCWVGDSGICGVVIFKMSRSTTLEGVQRSVTGLYESASVGFLPI